MQIVHSDSVFRVQPGDTPDYNRGNSLLKLLALMERVRLGAERETYLGEHLQFLFPFEFLELYGPQGNDADVLDPEVQDNKVDFQKQNVRGFRTADAFLVRGWAQAGNRVVPFLRFSYRGGPDSLLSGQTRHQLGQSILMWVKVGNAPSPDLITVPYNALSDRYEVELWSYPDGNLRDQLGAKGRDALDRGEIQVRNDLLNGTSADFARENIPLSKQSDGTLNGPNMVFHAPNNSMHPVLPLHLEVAWANADASVWDSKAGANYQYEFSMIVRGWENYLGVGISPNPHGGVGFLEFRNLMSNYGRGATTELERRLNPWNFNAHGNKDHANCTCHSGGLEAAESFMAVDYMDLHIMKSDCGIGLHRHRDNQEVFLMMDGQGYMVIGDWLKMLNRERCFEIRTLRAGHFAMLKGGQIHGLMNPSDEDLSLFMFGGYD